MSLVRPLLAVAVGVTLLSAPLAAQNSPLSGTWKLNLAKSKYDPATLAPKSATSKYTVTATTVTVATDGVDSKGRTTHSEYTAKCDGSPAAWSGTIDGKPNPDQDGITVKCLNTTTLHVVNMLKGKPTTTLHIVVSADGKTRTVSTTGSNAQGVKVNHKAVYDKQ